MRRDLGTTAWRRLALKVAPHDGPADGFTVMHRCPPGQSCRGAGCRIAISCLLKKSFDLL